MDNKFDWNKISSELIKSGDFQREGFLNQLVQPPLEAVREMENRKRMLDFLAEETRIKEQRESDYKESVLASLQGIEKNTALLTEMTFLLQKSNDKQDETFALMVEILEIMKSKDQEEAESKFTDVMKKITTFTDNASTLQSLWGMANTVFNAYQALPF